MREFRAALLAAVLAVEAGLGARVPGPHPEADDAVARRVRAHAAGRAPVERAPAAR